MKKLVIILSFTLFVVSCESTTYEEISDNTPIEATVKYNADVKSIMDTNCTSCHSTTSFKPLSNYSQVRANIDLIIDRIQRPNGDPLKMPQGGFLSQSQINIFIKWKSDGLIEN